jgi:two-component system, NarL family, invasion response regulator UvrY
LQHRKQYRLWNHHYRNSPLLTMITKKEIQPIKVALADDHILLRNALASLINGFEGCRVILEVSNGRELQTKINRNELPHVLLLDLNMPEMDGFETAVWVTDNFPSIYILMLTMYDSEQALIRLLQAGVKGFLKKDTHPLELKFAIQSVVQSGYFYSQQTSGKLANLFRSKNGNTMALEKAMLTIQETIFLKLASSEKTYKEIALEMKLNPRAVDALRDHLFQKLDIKSRVGLAMYAIRQGLVAL